MVRFAGKSTFSSVLILAVLSLLSATLLVIRWQVAPPSPNYISIGDAKATVSHFYGPEAGQGVKFRWSKSLSALSLPALASRQIITVTADPARPPGSAPVHFWLLEGAQTLAEYQAVPGWHSYTATVATSLNPDIRLLIESDTFYPSQSDRRRLGMAVSQVSTSAISGRLGLIWPPALMLLLALYLPILGLFAGKLSARVWHAWAACIAGVILPLVASFLPPDMALPSATWLAGLLTIALVLAYSRTWLSTGSRLSSLLERVGTSLWELPAVAGLMTCSAVVFTWPLVMRLSDSLPGWPGDNFAFLYKFWWFRTAVFETHQWPFFDTNTFAPFGFNLGRGEPTLANTLPGVLLGQAFNDVVAYNLLALASFVISGIGAYLLVREIAGSRLAALLAAVAFAFCPYRLSQFAGHIQLLGTGWIALTFFFVERTLKTARLRDGVWTGLTFALAALSAWYYAYMVGLLLALYIIMRAILLRGATTLTKFWRPAVASAITFGLLTAPVAVQSLQIWSAGGLSHSPKAADEASASPLDYVIPNELHPVWGEPFMHAHANQNVIEDALYLGAVPVAIIIIGWLVARRAKQRNVSRPRLAWAWVVMLITAFVLSLGLTLHGLSGQVRWTWPGGATVPIAMPGQLLYDWLPLFSSMRAYARFGLMASLAVIVLMGIAWAGLVKLWPRRGSWLTLLMLCLIAADFWTAPYAWGTSRVEPSAAAKYLAAAPPGIIIQMPLPSALSGPALFAETYYHKPIAYGYDTFEPPEWSAARPALLDFPDNASLDVLKRWGVRYIVVSGNAYGADWPGTLAFLKSMPRLRHLADFAETRHWDVDPGVLDARPDMEEFVVPDNLAVFELMQ